MTDEIKKWGKSLIERMGKSHDYLQDKLEKSQRKNPDNKSIIELKNLLRDIQQYIERDL